MSEYPVTINVQAVDNASGSLQSIGGSVKTLITDFAGLASGAFNLIQGYESINRAAVGLDRANLMVQRSTETVDQAQKHLNETIEKYGVNSAEAKDASDKLSIAQTQLQVATDRADLAQNNYNDSITRFAITLGPSLITMGDKAIGMYNRYTKSAEDATTGTGKFNTSLDGTTTSSGKASSSGDSLAKTIGTVGAAVGAVAISIGLANSQMDQFEKSTGKVSDAERIAYDASMALGGGIGVELGSQLMKAIGLELNMGTSTDELAQKLTDAGYSIAEVRAEMSRLGTSSGYIDIVTSSMARLGAATDSTAASANNAANALYAAMVAAGASEAAAESATNAYNNASEALRILQSGQGTWSSTTPAPTTTTTSTTPTSPTTPQGGAIVRYYESGGIATKQQLAVLAEKEPEAVIPLSKLDKMGRSGNVHIEVRPFIHIGSYNGGLSVEEFKRKFGAVITEVVSESIAQTYEGEAY